LLELLEKMKGTNSKEKDEIKAQLTALTAKIGEAMKKAREGVAKQKAVPAVASSAPVSAAAWKKLSADSEKQRLDRELELLSKSKAVDTSAAAAATSGTVGEAAKGEAKPAETEGVETTATSSSSPSAEKEAVGESRVEALQKTLASLQEEAKKLGIPAAEIAAQGEVLFF
jgi:hypothetical protein